MTHRPRRVLLKEVFVSDSQRYNTVINGVFYNSQKVQGDKGQS